jgi:hypothetical protein
MNQSGIGSFFISDTTDQTRIDMAVRQAEKSVEEILARGADKVFLATVPYHFCHGDHRENEHVVVEEFNRRNQGKSFFIDVTSPTYLAFPLAQQGDVIHPNKYGHRMAGALYLKALLDHDGLPMPQWVYDEIREGKEREVERNSHIRYISPRSGRYKKGDVITVSFDIDCGYEEFAKKGYLIGMYTDKLDSRDRSDYAFVNGNVDILSKSIPCRNGTQTYDIPVDQALIDKIKDKLLYKKNFLVGGEPENYGGAVPVLITVSIDDPHHSYWGGSTHDLYNRQNMVLIQLGNDNELIYPDGFYAPKHRAVLDSSKWMHLLNIGSTDVRDNYPSGKGYRSPQNVLQLSGHSALRIEIITMQGRLLQEIAVDRFSETDVKKSVQETLRKIPGLQICILRVTDGTGAAVQSAVTLWD